MNQRDPSRSINRRTFLQRSAVFSTFAAFGPLHAFGERIARGESPAKAVGYGPLVDKGDLWLPAEFNYQIISRQGDVMSDGNPTPGIFDGMGAFSDVRGIGSRHRTILIRNHENREFGEEIRVQTTPALEYDPQAFGGNTKLVVERRATGIMDPITRRETWEYAVVRDFAILGGTTTNCAGGEMRLDKWITCEEVPKRSPNGIKHGYVFEVDAHADGPVAARPVLGAGRFAHEAVAWRNGILYLTEDRGIDSDELLGPFGACFYRYIPAGPRRPRNLADTTGTLQALKIRGETHANMDTGRIVGQPYPVEWVTVDEPDHDDDSDNRRDRVTGFTPTRIQAQDKGAAFFNRLEGAWATGAGRNSKIYFDCTSGGAAHLGQVWEFNVGAETLTLRFESANPETLRHPDNLVVVPQTRDVFLCEDGGGVQFIRGLTGEGEIFDFAKTGTNFSEFCGACFDRGGNTLFVNQQGDRGSLPAGPPGAQAVTYAIYGPFRKRKR